MNFLAFLILTVILATSSLNMNCLLEDELMFSGLALSLLRTKASVKILMKQLNRLKDIMDNLKIILNLNIFL